MREKMWLAGKAKDNFEVVPAVSGNRGLEEEPAETDIKILQVPLGLQRLTRDDRENHEQNQGHVGKLSLVFESIVFVQKYVIVMLWYAMFMRNSNKTDNFRLW